jgi:2'-phosphotransferase
MKLDRKVAEDIEKCVSMDEGPASNESLLRIIDPDGVLPFEAHTPSAPSGYHKRWQGTNGRWKAQQSGQQLGRESWSTEVWSGMNHLESVSRKLSLVLRHDTKIPVRSDGFCKLNDILELRRFKDIGCTVEDINQVVDGAHESGNSKQRFQVRKEGEELWIRANQGYSRKDILAESAYRRLHLDDPNLPDPCVHGTYHWHWDSILKYGLLAGGLAGRHGRNEIHFASEEPGSRRAISGLRHDCDVAIWLDLRRALKEGLPFYISDNDVILSPGDANGAIPCRFFLKVEFLSKPPRQLWPPNDLQ